MSLKLDVCVVKSLNCDVGDLLIPQERARTAITHPPPNECGFTDTLADLDLTKQTDAQMSIQPAANYPHPIHRRAEAPPSSSGDVCVG